MNEYDKKYKYVEVAFNGVKNRNKILEIMDVKLPDDPAECYATYFRYSEDMVDYIKANKSVANYCGKCYATYLPFDIDNSNLEQAHKSTKLLVKDLERQYQLGENNLKIYFSGAGGFHVLLDSKLFDGFEPSASLPQTFKKIALELARDIKIDTSLYQTNRLFRLPNSINSKTGLHKVHITIKELHKLGIDEIKDIATQPRYNSLIFNSPSVPELVKLYESKRDLFHSSNKPKVNNISVIPSINFEEPCIDRMFKEGVHEGVRGQYCFQISIRLKEQKISEDKAYKLMLDWNKRNKTKRRPFTEEEVKKQVKAVYEDSIKKAKCCSLTKTKFCVGKEKCSFYQSLKKGHCSTDSAKSDYYFYYGWYHHLSGGTYILIRDTIPYLEKCKKLEPGSEIFTTTKELEEYSGLKNPGRNLPDLKAKGLIEYTPGVPFKGIPTKIRRIIPISEPRAVTKCYKGDTLQNVANK